MKAREIKKDIYWVGAVDWNVRDFHGYKTSRGTSYNAYLIIDEKVVLVDTVKATFKKEMMGRIKSIIDPSKIDIIISNHVEMDHSGCISDILEFAPNAKVITSINGEKGLKEHFDTASWNMQVVKSGELLNIGKRDISFVHTPMLHWPDSMVCYCPTEKLLFSNDSFGQHMASEEIMEEGCLTDVVMEEALKYYANIVYPYGAQVTKAINIIKDLEIEMIAPSHGVIFQKSISRIIEKYLYWSESKNSGKALVIYDSMWGSTEKMAHTIKDAFEEGGIPVQFRNLKTCHISDIMADILEAKYIAIGSPILNSQMLPSMGGLLTYMKGLKPKEKRGFGFGSYGWSKAAISEIENLMTYLKWDIMFETKTIKYRPNSDDLNDIRESVLTSLKEENSD